MSSVDPRTVAAVFLEHSYAVAGVLVGLCVVVGVYRLIRHAFSLGYGMWVTAREPERAAEIIDATLRRPAPRRRPTEKGG